MSIHIHLEITLFNVSTVLAFLSCDCLLNNPLTASKKSLTGSESGRGREGEGEGERESVCEAIKGKEEVVVVEFTLGFYGGEKDCHKGSHG